VAARDHQGQRGQRDVGRGQERGLEVPGDVVDADQRFAVDEGDRLRHLQPHQQRAHEARALGDRDRVEGRVVEPGLGHGAAHHGHDVLDVVARRQLGHHPAVGRMDRDLGGDHVREDGAAVGHHRGRGLVAGGLDGQEDGHEGFRARAFSESS
jgi:hypothetical protein